MNHFPIGQLKSHGLEKPSQIDDVITKNKLEASSGKEADSGDILVELGFVDLIFPDGKHHDDSYEDKLYEFIHYQPLQSYMAPGSPEAIRLSSPEGKAMLREALSTPYMESFYTVSPQVENQPENACTSTSLVVALNSLEIDPGRPFWYETYCWHHLGSLACCTPRLQNPNMTLDQFACLAVCNDTRAFPVTVTDDWTLDQLRSWVKMASSRSDVVMVLNYGRREMKQAGIGHFLPLSGYHEGRDMFLMVDIAKHKYRPQWIPLQMLLASLKAKDDRTGLNRGFVLLQRPDHNPGENLFMPSLLFRLDDVPGQGDDRFFSFMGRWNRFLEKSIPADMSPQDVIPMTIQNLKSFITSEDMTSRFSMLDMTLVNFRNDHSICPSIVARCRRPQCPATCPNTMFCQQLESLEVFKHVHTCLESWTNEDRGQIVNLVAGQLSDIDQAVRFAKANFKYRPPVEKAFDFFKELYSQPGKMFEKSKMSQTEGIRPAQCPGYIELFPEHIATFVLLSWPYVFNSKIILGQNGFRSMFSKYELSPLDFDNNNNNNTAESTDRRKRNIEECNESDFEHDKQENETSSREYLNQMMNIELRKSDCQFLKEQVRVLKLKLLVILNYHHLIK